MPKDKQCVQRIDVKVKKVDAKYIGCGISKADPNHRPQPIPVRLSTFYILVFLLKLHKLPGYKQSEAKEVKSIIHPDELNLQRISSDEEVIERCGMQLFEIYNEEDPEKMVSGYDFQKFHPLICIKLDFWLYEAFPQNVLKTLISHHRQLGKVKSVKRGAQFNSFSQGKMVPKGGRISQGGRPGDAYTFYEGMEAITLDDIDALFNDAEVCCACL
jgi:hypothetical protein